MKVLVRLWRGIRRRTASPSDPAPVLHPSIHLKSIASRPQTGIEVVAVMNPSGSQQSPGHWDDLPAFGQGYFWPERNLYRISSCWVHAKSGLLFSDDALISESGQLYAPSTYEADWNRISRIEAGYRPTTAINQSVIVVPPIHAYWHWLAEWLPRVLHAHRVDNSVSVALCGLHPPKYVFESLIHLGIQHINLVADTYLRSAYVPDKNDWHWVHPDDVSLVREYLRLTSKPPANHSVYVSRRFSRRALPDEVELESFLANRGFLIFHPNKISWPDQVALFSQAREIIGPWGSGLANMIFMSPGGTVTEIHTPFVPDPAVRNLALSSGHHWTRLRTPANQTIAGVTVDDLVRQIKPFEELPPN
jgi:capsular polysaccharide biosynthesis protein